MAIKYPADLDINKNAIITFKAFKWQLLNRGQAFTTMKKNPDSSTIILPIQSDLTISEPENWTEGEGGRFASGDIKNRLTALARSYGLKMKDKMLETVGQSFALNAGRNKAGKIRDDFLALTYAGVPLFENSFTFSFVPKNQKEVMIIENIIFEFRTKSLPVFENGAIDYPDIWDVDIRVAGKQIMRYPYCAITDVSTNYNPDGHIHLTKDGNLIRIDLTISIKQITQIDRNDMTKILHGRGT